ncbi:MAG: T9SS type A sorting domain-containing protein [Schleiferiaceae bacterium]|nr:T9SS type A sorting domain-containing protein [Schleiferiaceae bacterium]
MKAWMVMLFFTVFVFCGMGQSTPDIVASPVTPLQAPMLESSGLAFIQGRIFTHNDSGNNPFLFEVDTLTGAVLRTVFIEATNVDWEDLAQDSTHLYIADFGNNLGNRQNLVIYKALWSDVLAKDTIAVDTIAFHYPEQTVFPGAPFQTAYDAESLVAIGDSLYLINKSWNANFPNYVYRLPKTPGTYAAELIDSLDFMPLIAGADFCFQDSTLYLIGYMPPFNQLHAFKSASAERLSLTGQYERKTVSFPGSIQVEGIVKGVGNTLYFSSEVFQGRTPHLSRVDVVNSLHAYAAHEMRRNKVYAYPNPALSGVFWLKDFVAPVDVQVFDATGKQVPVRIVLSDEQVQVQVLEGSTGSYFVWINDGVGESLLKLQITYE